MLRIPIDLDKLLGQPSHGAGSELPSLPKGVVRRKPLASGQAEHFPNTVLTTSRDLGTFRQEYARGAPSSVPGRRRIAYGADLERPLAGGVRSPRLLDSLTNRGGAKMQSTAQRAICRIALLLAMSLLIPLKALPKGSPWKLALHSVSYAGVWRGQAYLDIDRFLETAKSLGFDGVMIMAKEPHVSPLTYDDKARARLRAKLDELGLELCILAGYTDFTGGIDRGGIPVAEIQAAYVGQLAKLAADLGTDKLRIFTGYLREGIPYDQQYATVVRGLKLAAREAAKYGVTLAIQNHHDIANHHDEMIWLLREVNEPNVKVAFDAWTPTLQGLSSQELAQAVQKMAPYMVHTTVADYIRLPRFRYEAQLTNFLPLEPVVRAVPMGTGIVDYATFFKALKKAGYKGWVAYEMCEVLEGGGSLENLARTAKQFIEYMRNLNLE